MPITPSKSKKYNGKTKWPHLYQKERADFSPLKIQEETALELNQKFAILLFKILLTLIKKYRKNIEIAIYQKTISKKSILLRFVQIGLSFV